MPDLPARPLGFKEAMFEAAVEGRKTLTSRVIVPQPTEDADRKIGHIGPELGGDPTLFRTWLDRTAEGKGACETDYNPETWRCRYGPVGTPLYLQEPFKVVAIGGGEWPDSRVVQYKWHDTSGGWGNLRTLWPPDSHLDKPAAQPRDSFLSPRFMPQWAARWWSRNEGVEVARVQDITREDCFAEGIRRDQDLRHDTPAQTATWPIDSFAHLWDSINAKRGYPWAANPWVWRIRFAQPEEARDG